MSLFWFRHQVSLLYFVGVLLLIAVSNLWAWRKLGSYPKPLRLPRVSILLPVREEENNVTACVTSLLAQDYPDWQLIVLDDDSHDATPEALAALARENPALQVLKGKRLPEGWLGKNWACQQLAAASDGELLLFVDADTRLEPEALRESVAALEAERADLVSVFPRQEVLSWGERLVVPILQWSTLSFVPLALAYRWPVSALVTASGQFMLFRRQAYEAIGGHAAVRDQVVEDVALARRITRHGLRWRLLDGSRYVHCRMYRGFRQVYEGLSKNLFPLFDYNAPFFTFVWLYLLTVFWEPFVVLALWRWGVTVTLTNVRLALALIALSLPLWAITYWRFGFPLYLVPLYPLTICLSCGIAMRSMFVTLRGRATWKGRVLAKPQRR